MDILGKRGAKFVIFIIGDQIYCKYLEEMPFQVTTIGPKYSQGVYWFDVDQRQPDLVPHNPKLYEKYSFDVNAFEYFSSVVPYIKTLDT